MIKQPYQNTTLLHFDLFNKQPEIKAFSTTREKGFSQAPYSGLNMGPTTADKTDHVTSNHRALAESIESPGEALFFTRQVHGNQVVRVDSLACPVPEADALITQSPGICICVQTADCVPILLFDPENKAVAAVHSGWRGTVQHILVRTLEAMNRAFGTNPAKVLAGIGPSISPEVYEVGTEVIEQVKSAFPHTWQQLLKPGISEDKAMLDLWRANHQLLTASGVRAHHIEMAQMCTFSNPNLFYSARRDGAKTGRMASGIILR